jgi:hypothetical protein
MNSSNFSLTGGMCFMQGHPQIPFNPSPSHGCKKEQEGTSLGLVTLGHQSTKVKLSKFSFMNSLSLSLHVCSIYNHSLKPLYARPNFRLHDQKTLLDDHLTHLGNITHGP